MTKSNSPFYKNAKWKSADRATRKKIKDSDRDSLKTKFSKEKSSKDKLKKAS